jgi:hypothetical protein
VTSGTFRRILGIIATWETIDIAPNPVIGLLGVCPSWNIIAEKNLKGI